MTTKCAPFRRWAVRIVVYLAHRKNTWQEAVGVERVVPYRFSFKGGGVSLITEGSWGSEGSSQSDLGSTMG